MVLDPSELESGILGEMERFRALVDSVPPSELATRTRFWGLPIRDVAAHMAGVVTDVTTGRREGLATPAAVARQLREREGATHSDLLAELDEARSKAEELLATFTPEIWDAPAPADFEGSIAEAIQAIWEDLWIHGDDIRDALSIEPDRGPGLRASVHHLVGRLQRRGWGPGSIELDGLEVLSVGSGGSTAVTGDPHAFVLAGTSRVAPGDHGFDQSIVVET